MSEATSHVGDPRAPVLEVIRDGLPRQLRIEAGDEGLAGEVLGEERDAVDGPWRKWTAMDDGVACAEAANLDSFPLRLTRGRLHRHPGLLLNHW